MRVALVCVSQRKLESRCSELLDFERLVMSQARGAYQKGRDRAVHSSDDRERGTGARAGALSGVALRGAAHQLLEDDRE